MKIVSVTRGVYATSDAKRPAHDELLFLKFYNLKTIEWHRKLMKKNAHRQTMRDVTSQSQSRRRRKSGKALQVPVVFLPRRRPNVRLSYTI